MSSTLEEFLNAEDSDPDLMPTILPVDARLSFEGPVASVMRLFQKLLPVVPTTETIYGTNSMLLEAYEEGHVRSTATDGEKSMRVIERALDVKMPGAALVPVRKLHEIFKLLEPERRVRLDVLGNTVFVRYGRATWEVVAPVGDSLPPLADIDSITVTEVPTQAFLEALRVVWKALPPFRPGSQQRPALTQVEINDGHVTAADGMRVHRKKVDGLPTSLHFSIPAAVVEVLIKELGALQEGTPTFDMGYDGFHIYIGIDDNEIIAQRLMVPYPPDVENIVLTPAMLNDFNLTVNVNDLNRTITRVRVNADPDYAAIYVQVSPTKDPLQPWQLVLRARDKQGNSSRETVPVSFDGPKKARELVFSHKNLQDLLSVCSEEEVTFRVGDDTKAKKMPLFLETSDGLTAVVQQIVVGI